MNLKLKKRHILCSVFCILCSVTFATQLSFNSGRLSELMKYRVDTDKRSMGVEEAENILIRPKGMAYRRPGTEFVDDMNDLFDVRLISFEYATDDAYPLEFGHKKLGFFRTTE